MIVNFLFLLPIIFGFFLIGSFSNSFAEIESIDVVENKLVTLIGKGIDPDTENLTFQWVQVNGEPVTLSSYVIPEPTFIAPDVKNGEIKVLTFELTVTDPQGAYDTAIVEIIVNPVNSPPYVEAGRDRFALQPISAMTITPSVSDPDDDVLTYQWEQIGGQTVNLSSAVEKYLTLRPITFDFTNTEPLNFKITVDDGFGGVSSDTVRVHLFTDDLDNHLISIDAGPIQRVTEGERVTLSATGETLNNQPIRYSWVQIVGTQVKLSSFIGDQVTFIAPEVGDDEELLSFQVTGYSPGSGYANDLALVKVIPSNAAPIANAGLDQNVAERKLVKLEGSGTDPDNDKLKYSWSQKSGIPVELYQRTTSSVYFISPTIMSLSEPLVFELKVSDNHGLSDTDDVTINVISPNSPPRVYAGADKRVSGGSSVVIMGTAVDLDSDSLKIEWKQIFGDAVNFDKTNLKLSFIAPDVSPTISKRLAFELTATDPQGLSASDQVIVYVSPENSAPKANAGMDISVNENTVTNLKCIGSDPDGDSLSYVWSTSSNAIIDQSTSSATSVKIPKVVRDTTISMTCTVDDGQHSASDSMNIMIKNTLDLDIIANAGDDKIVNENVLVSLDGSKSNDPEQQELYFKWTQLSGEQVKLSSASGLTPSFTSPTVANNQIKVLTFELKVFDDNGRESTDVVTVTVDPVNSVPEASATAIQ